MKIRKSLIFFCAQFIVMGSPMNAKQANDSLCTAYVSYFGESITHPGLKLGMQFILSGKNPIIKPNAKTVYRQLTVRPNIGFYYHPGNHTGVFINTEIGFRIIRPRGFMGQISLGAGYQRTFLAAKTYELSEQDDFRRVVLAGSNQFMPSMNIALGKVMKGENRRIISYYAGIGGFLQYPYNGMWLPSLVLEMGIALRFSKNE
jgi:hypothetical protein